MLNNRNMNINELKDCIHYEVIGSERPFSWRKAIVRAIKHRRVRYLFWWRIAKYLFDKGGYCRKIAGKIERFILDKYNVTVPGFAPIFPDICYHLTHYKPAAADIPVASDNPAHYADAIRYNARTPLQGSLLPLTRLVWA